jgi:hypothetical protein
MKKITLIALFMTSMVAHGQFNYKIGIITSLPADIYGESYHVGIGSGFFEINHSISKKISAVANTGYIRFVGESKTKFAQIPIFAGVKYKINDSYYFGCTSGISIYNKKSIETYKWTYSPFIGVNFKKISVDVRYLNSIDSEIPQKTLNAVFSYTL